MAGAIKHTDCISAKGCNPHGKFPEYDTKQSDDQVLVMELWGMRSIPSLLLLPGPLWPEVVAPDRVLSMGQIKLFGFLLVCKQITR